MNCRNAERLLATRRDLDPDQARAVQTHLLGCDRCAAAWQRERRTSQLLQSLPTAQAQLSPQVAVNIRARLRRPPRRWKHQFVAATVVALFCLVFLGAVAAQAYPQAVQQAAARLGLRPAASSQLYFVSNAADPQGGYQPRLRRFDLETQQVVAEFDGGEDLVWSPDGARLYISGGDISGVNNIRAVEQRTQGDLWHATLPTGFISLHESMAISPDGRWLYLVVYHHDQTNTLSVDVSSVPKLLIVIDAATGQVQPQTIALPDAVQLPHLMTPRSGTMVYLFDRQIYPLNTATQQIEEVIPAPANWFGTLVNAVLPSPDGRQLYVLGGSHKLAIFDLEQQTYVAERLLPAPKHTDYAEVRTAISADGTRLVVASAFRSPLQDGVPLTQETMRTELMAYDTQTWELAQRIGLDREVSDVGTSADGLKVYAAATPLLAPGQQMFSPDRATVYVVPNTILTFDVASGQIQNEYTREGEVIARLFVAP